MKYQIHLTNKQIIQLECKPVVSNSSLILNSNKQMIAAYNASQWLKIERVDLNDLIDETELD